jgi:hypothetical protein
MVIESALSPTGGTGPLLERVRRDALPEEIVYRDDGCDMHPRCLTCPLPRCRYDEPGGLRAMLNTYRDQQIVTQRQEGALVDQIAERYSLSRRTVFRILSASARADPSACNRAENGYRQTSSQGTKEEVHA